MVLKCSCTHAHCCKVLSFKAVCEAMRQARSDPTACPAEPGSPCATYSELVVHFLQIAAPLLPGYWFIWDMHDVPGEPMMHIDVTAVCPGQRGLVYRFEIDGNRAVHIPIDAQIPREPLAILIHRALTYHLNR